jgi:hypothetical protein
MSATSTVAGLEKLTMNLTKEIRVKASLEHTFEALLEQMGPENETPQGKMPMTIEPWPGGRWFRDLDGHNGHYWATVQAIKRPELLELCGPLVYVLPSAQQSAVPADEDRRGHAHHMPPFGAGRHS